MNQKGGFPMKKRQSFILMGLAYLILVSAITPISSVTEAAPTPEKPMTLNYDFWLPATVKDVPVIEKFLKGLEDATRGAVKTKLQAGGAMGPGSETYDRVLGGVSDIGHFGPGFTPGVFPMFSIFDYPIRFPSAEALAKAQHEMYKRGYFDKEFGRVKVIGLLNIGPYVLYTSKRRVTTVKDFSGLKIRCPSEGWVQFSKALGAIPVSMPSGEVYIALQKGITDANLMPWDGAVSFKLAEVARYVTELSMGTFTHLIVMNKKTWESLPQEAKDYIDKNWMENSLVLARANDAMRVRAIELYSKTPDRETVHISREEWQKINPLVNSMWLKWISDREAKGLPAKKGVEELQNILTNAGVENPIVGYTPGK
jgi:TRAP-type C4-dicarboxylate transport system substrate-binding protein